MMHNNKLISGVLLLLFPALLAFRCGSRGGEFVVVGESGRVLTAR